METIIINVEDKSKAKLVLGAVKLLNGVAKDTLATEDDLENISMLKACKEPEKQLKPNTMSLNII